MAQGQPIMRAWHLETKKPTSTLHCQNPQGCYSHSQKHVFLNGLLFKCLDIKQPTHKMDSEWTSHWPCDCHKHEIKTHLQPCLTSNALSIANTINLNQLMTLVRQQDQSITSVLWTTFTSLASGVRAITWCYTDNIMGPRHNKHHIIKLHLSI